ncbi:WD40 repeat-like protein [Rhizoctonia solani]|uniref:WD40 repeat-like protein n=1 Tax=Rhizoctonia solani TaxID=456999 RepID=A0A8H7I7X2_9AGAM|nr:WD40 repeat-like protein [Rhizoctonia solani]
MSSPPGTPKQRRRIMRLLETFNRTHSRSTSQKLLQSSPETSSLAIEPNQSKATPSLVTDNSEDVSIPVEESAIGIVEPNLSVSDISVNNVAPLGQDITTIPPIQSRSGRNEAWGGLQEALQILEDALPPLSLAFGSVLSCLEDIEANYEDLATEFTVLLQSLKKPMDESPLIMNSASTAGVAIDKLFKSEKHSATKRAVSAGQNIDEEKLVGHYRQIQSHFRRLQMSTNVGVWSTENEQLANARFQSLNSAKQAAYDSSISTKINRRGCTEGTRIGVLDGLNDWLFNPKSSSIYWMNGMAGTGKTTIVSTFCERVERYKLLAASFFCTRSSAECRDVNRIIPTISYQLAQYSIPFRSALSNILGQTPDISSKNILKQFNLLLKEPLEQLKDSMPDNMVVVIDALDECENQNGVELVLDMLFRHAAQVPVKFLVTSRPEPEIYTKMSTHANHREVLHLHDIEKSLVQGDIELYLKDELSFMAPTPTEIAELAQRAGTLFIYAATLVRYISGKRFADNRKRLRAVWDMKPESKKQQYSHIDALYKTVLESALSEDELDVDEVEDIQLVLRMVLLAQEPVNVKTIAELTGIGDQRRVEHALPYLRSVLHQPKSESQLVSTLHASFPDFMFSEERSGPYFCNRGEWSQLIARMSFLVMKEQLHFNICDLPSSFVPDKEIVDLKSRISDNISPTLAYTCRYWASHLKFVSTQDPDALLTMLSEFISQRLLFWVEVLSLRQEILIGVDGLLKAQQWLLAMGSPSPELVLFVDDARSFVAGFAVNPVSQSTPHLYLSSLAFCPQSSLVYKHYRKRAHGLLELEGSLMDRREAAPLAIWNASSEIQSVAMSPDGTRVAIGCLDTTVSILSAYDGTVHVGPLQGHTNSVDTVAFSPGGERLVSGSLGGIRVWNTYNGIQIAGPFKGHMRFINCVAFSPDGASVVSCAHDSTVRVWNADDGEPILGPFYDHSDLVLRVSFSPDGTLIASSSADRTIRLWKVSNGTPAAPPFEGHTGWVDSLVFTPDGARLISSSTDKSIRIWNVMDGTLVTHSFADYAGGVNGLAISPDGKRVAAACNDRAVRVWNIDDGRLVAGPFYGHTDSVKSVVYSPMVLASFLVLPTKLSMYGISLAFCPDNIHFLSSDVHEAIRIWDSSDGSFITAPDKAKFFPTPLSSLSPNGSYIASTKDGMVQVTSTTNGALVVGPFDVERNSLSTFLFSHNSKAIIMGCQDGLIKVCDLQSEARVLGSFRAHPRGVSSLIESSDCSVITSYSDYENVLRIWNIVAPSLDIQPRDDTLTGTAPRDTYAAVHEGWSIAADGWVVNKVGHLLFWLPPAIASAWCSPYARLVITRSGTLRVPKQRPFIGGEWFNCYSSNETQLVVSPR